MMYFTAELENNIIRYSKSLPFTKNYKEISYFDEKYYTQIIQLN